LHILTHGIGRFLGAFGLMLGMGFITTMPSPAMVALLFLLWHVHSLWFTIVVFEAFAITRGLTTFATLPANAQLRRCRCRRGHPG
jgi:hypothetical protein